MKQESGNETMKKGQNNILTSMTFGKNKKKNKTKFIGK